MTVNLEHSSCIICENSDFTHYLDVESKDDGHCFSLKICKCSLVLTSPRPSVADIDKYYTESYAPHFKANSKKTFLNKIFKNFSYFWKGRLIKKIFKNKISLLDIGGGDGALALYLKDKISLVHVYEKNKKCVDFINQKNIFSTDSFKDLEEFKYNLVTLFHSLEHIHEIDELFLNINRITVEDAKMIIAVPNINAAEINFLSADWVAWDPPRHLYHFSFKTLSALLNKHGWEVAESRNLFQDTFFNIYMSLRGNFIKKILLSFILIIYSITNQIFSSNKRSSILIICQKK